MYELEHAKDQVMTVLKLALANVVMWTRDTYFPAAYAQATWRIASRKNLTLSGEDASWEILLCRVSANVVDSWDIGH